MNETAAEAASPASFHPRKAHTRAGARSPSGRRSQIRGCIDSPYRMPVWLPPISHPAAHPSWREMSATATDMPATVATLRPGDLLDGVYACSRKDRLLSRVGTPYL